MYWCRIKVSILSTTMVLVGVICHAYVPGEPFDIPKNADDAAFVLSFSDMQGVD
jgi:hypothetical protein